MVIEIKVMVKQIINTNTIKVQLENYLRLENSQTSLWLCIQKLKSNINKKNLYLFKSNEKETKSLILTMKPIAMHI